MILQSIHIFVKLIFIKTALYQHVALPGLHQFPYWIKSGFETKAVLDRVKIILIISHPISLAQDSVMLLSLYTIFGVIGRCIPPYINSLLILLICPRQVDISVILLRVIIFIAISLFFIECFIGGYLPITVYLKCIDNINLLFGFHEGVVHIFVLNVLLNSSWKNSLLTFHVLSSCK